MVYAKEALVNIAVCRICEANGDVDNAEITAAVVPLFLIFSYPFVSFCFSLRSMRSLRFLLQLVQLLIYAGYLVCKYLVRTYAR